ncbi:hypothetical protein [Burkholderia sp. Ac-20353]|uniref:hypothetical protein n=1 Tax=Burkholderia sp. Ac-20353 TaxID=2703894 RepID=UPI00197BE725|nr:hypothetical protein [Burkholderia sp. Ac-20353]MBN3786588.1 hypothetical protein [Burkholderia sp. Ac-20353]
MKKALMWIVPVQFEIDRACRSSIFRLSYWRVILRALSSMRRVTSCFPIRRFGLGVVLILSFWTVGSHAQEARYRYVSLDQIALPAGFASFSPTAIQNSGRVYGTLCDATCGVIEFAYFENGTLTVLPPVPAGSFSGPVNARGTIGGSILVDPVNGVFRAALFQGGRVKLVPPQPGELSAFVFALNDNDTALVESDDASGPTFVLYRGGTATPINFGQSIVNPFFSFIGNCTCINNNEIIEGIAKGAGDSLYNGTRGFRFDTRNGNAAILDPFPGDPTETLSWGQGIDQAGNVLGYSFVLAVPGTPYHERIGVWGPNGVFYTYLVETDSSSRLLFNDNGLIVITALATSFVSYVVPRPGVRLNLADLVVNLPVGQDLSSITGLNNHGDMIGFSSTFANFLLQRLDNGDSRSFPTPVVNNARHSVPPMIAIMRNRLLPQSGRIK